MHEEMMLIKAELERYKQITIYWEQKARSAEHQRRDILNQALDGHPEVRCLPFSKVIFIEIFLLVSILIQAQQFFCILFTSRYVHARSISFVRHQTAVRYSRRIQ
jgi:hypothetical protein